MIDQLITALNQEMDLSAEDIADTIWLALQINPSQSKLTNSQPSKDDTRQKSLNKDKFNQENKKSVDRQKSQTSEEEQSDTNKAADSQKAVISPRNLQQTSKTSELTFKVPNAPSLREPLTLARALKPLMRRLPSGTNMVLDEVATTQRIADEGLWLPVLKPMREPWLDLELVVDESISMQIWRRTIRELERLLKNYGIFRDVRVWGLISDQTEQKEEVKLNKHSKNSVIATKGKSSQIPNSISPQIQIRRGLGATAKNQFPRSPKELIDPTNRRLVLVVSDCVSSFWGKDEIRKTLELWSNHLPLAIVQMLPQWLWERTALGRESEVRLRGLTAGIANQYLIHQEVSLWEELEEENPIKVPIFTLESTSVATWAQMLSGKGNIWTLGYVFERDISQRKTGVFKSSSGELTAEQRVQRFRVTASPMARKLAGLLSASPVISLPVVRLIQETMLKESLQVNVAEVFLGGLLKPLSEINAQTNPDYVLYEFWDGVRNLLVDSVPSNYVLTILDKVSEYVAKKAGLSLEEFTAVLKQEKVVKNSDVIESIDYLATVTAQVLRRLGGEYAELADELERDNQGDSQTDIQTDLDSWSDFTYQIGGSLPFNSPYYIKRQADEELYNALVKGQFCYLSAPRQMGKTSLITQVSQRLKEQGFACAWIDLAMIGSRVTQEQFFFTLVYMVVQEFELRHSLESWYEERKQLLLSPPILCAEFIEEILLKEISQPMIIFIDEIDYILHFDFASDFFSLLRSLYQRISLSGKRGDNQDYNPLTFVLSGVFLKDDLNPNIYVSPLLNIAVPIELKGFTYEEAFPLVAGLREKTNNPQQLLKSILEWTGGQPFLTQRLCDLVTKSDDFSLESSHSQTFLLEQLVQTKIINDWELQDKIQHLRIIRDRIIQGEKATELLKLYQLILQNEDNQIDKIAGSRQAIQELMLTGLVVRTHKKLRVANIIYANVFNQKWVDKALDAIILSIPVICIGERAAGKTSLLVALASSNSQYVQFKTPQQSLSNLTNSFAQETKIFPKPPPPTDTIEQNLLEVLVHFPSGIKEIKFALFETPSEYWQPSFSLKEELELEVLKRCKAIFLILPPYREIVKSEVNKEMFITRNQCLKRFEHFVDYLINNSSKAHYILLCLNQADLFCNNLDTESQKLAYDFSKTEQMSWLNREKYVRHRYFTPFINQIKILERNMPTTSVRCFITSIYNRSLLELPWIYLSSFLD